MAKKQIFHVTIEANIGEIDIPWTIGDIIEEIQINEDLLVLQCEEDESITPNGRRSRT